MNMSSMTDSFYPLGYPDAGMINLLNEREDRAAALAIENHDSLVFALQQLLDALGKDKLTNGFFKMERHHALKVLEAAQ